MSQNEKIRALYVQPGKYPEVIKIPNTLESFQKYVGGDIGYVTLIEKLLLFLTMRES